MPIINSQLKEHASSSQSRVIEYLDICEGSVIAVIGCGGKTSLMELLANKLQEKKVLVSTTTKMFPVKGILCTGLLNEASGKLEALPPETLAGLIPQHDITLLEADGSRGLPCKGWLPNEPAVPRYCTHTVGIVTMNVLGKTATETIVHRLPEFLSLTGLKEGETITAQAIEAMVCAPEGMFKNSAGKQYLLVNQAEDKTAAKTAHSFLQAIKEKYPFRFKKLLYGSVRQDTWNEV